MIILEYVLIILGVEGTRDNEVEDEVEGVQDIQIAESIFLAQGHHDRIVDNGWNILSTAF